MAKFGAGKHRMAGFSSLTLRRARSHVSLLGLGCFWREITSDGAGSAFHLLQAALPDRWTTTSQPGFFLSSRRQAALPGCRTTTTTSHPGSYLSTRRQVPTACSPTRSWPSAGPLPRMERVSEFPPFPLLQATLPDCRTAAATSHSAFPEYAAPGADRVLADEVLVEYRTLASDEAVVVQVKVEREETGEVEEKHQELYNSLKTETSPSRVKTEKSSSEETTEEEDFPGRQCDEGTDHVSSHTDEKHLSPKTVPSQEPSENPAQLNSTSAPHECPHCSKTFSLQSTLTRHVKTHSSVKSFSCSQCEKRFTHRGYLNMHMRIHTCEKPKHRQICSSGQTGAESVLRCAHCGDVVRRTSVLHTNSSSLTCQKCGKDFTIESPTATGTRTADKRLTCSQCGKPFSRRNALKVHTGEKPFSCSQCGRSFANKENLTRHLRSHTANRIAAANDRRETPSVSIWQQNLPWDVLADKGPSAFPRYLSSPAKAQLKVHLQKQIKKSELEMDSIRLQIVARTLAIKQAALEVEMLERRLKDMKK